LSWLTQEVLQKQARNQAVSKPTNFPEKFCNDFSEKLRATVCVAWPFENL